MRESRTSGSVRAKAEWLSYSTNHHAQQQLSFFHGYYEGHMYNPLLIFGGRTGFPLADYCARATPTPPTWPWQW
jgi:hypothetical protein